MSITVAPAVPAPPRTQAIAFLSSGAKEADEALYQAKAAGRDGYVFGGRSVGDLVAFESAA